MIKNINLLVSKEKKSKKQNYLTSLKILLF
jgi:hypothetical protein